MENSLLKRIIIENQERIPKLKIFNRKFFFEENANYILTGQRRAGKTFLLYHRIQELIIKNNISQNQILYINFEDERLLEFNINHFDFLLESYKELYDKKPYIFLDEIQNIAGWEKFARRLADSGYFTYITGSNAKMLSNELATTLGGRYLIKEIDTLSFPEYLVFKEFKNQKNIEFSESRFEVKRLFSEWFSYGGFPEIIKFQDKREYLNSIFLKVFLGDILTRHGIRNRFALQLIIKKLAEGATDEVSFNRIKHIIQSTGIKIGTATVIEYVGYLEDSFLIKSIKNFGSKISSKETRRKYYFRDHGLLSLFLNEPSSLALETLVFNHLNRKNQNKVYYIRDKYEIDFLVPDNRQLIQVAFDMSNIKTRDREIKAILLSNETFGYKDLIILTFDSKEETIEINGMKIAIQPVWKWLLN